MVSPGTTKSGLWETYRQRCNMAMIAFGRVNFISGMDSLAALTGQSTGLNKQSDKSDNHDVRGA